MNFAILHRKGSNVALKGPRGSVREQRENIGEPGRAARKHKGAWGSIEGSKRDHIVETSPGVRANRRGLSQQEEKKRQGSFHATDKPLLFYAIPDEFFSEFEH